MKIKKFSSIVSLAFTGHRLHAAQLKRSGTRIQVVRTMQTAMAMDPLNNDPQLVGRELRRHLDEAGINERRCIVSLPLRWAFVLPVDLPELPEADRESFLALQAERGFPFALEDLIQSTTWPHPRRATMVAMPINYVTALLAALAAAKLKAVSITLGVTSLADASLTHEREGIDLLVGDEGLEMAVRAGDGFAALRPLDDAMERELDAARFDGEMIVRQMRITLGQLPAALMGGVKTVTIYGAESLTRPLMEQIRPLLSRLSLTLEAGKVGETRGAAGLEAAPQTIGAGMRCLRGLPAAVELLPHKVSRWSGVRKRIASRRSFWIGASAVLLVLCVGGVFGWQSMQLSKLQTDWKAIEPRVKAIEAVQAQVTRFQPWYDNDPKTLRVLSDVTSAFPNEGSVWVTSLTIHDQGTVDCQIKAVDSQSYLAMTSRLRKLKSVSNAETPNIRSTSSVKDPIQLSLKFTWKATKANGS